MIPALILFAVIALAVAALWVAIVRALGDDLPHYDNPGDEQ